MELYQLRYLHAVVEFGGIRSAAQHLAVSPSAVSRAVAALQDEIGVPLFTRRGRVNEVNRFGVRFVDDTRAAVRSLDTALQSVRDMAGATTGTVSVGFLHSLGTTVMPRAIRSFRVDHPDVEVELHQRSGHGVIADLADGVTDLCLSVPGLFAEVAEVHWTPLFEEDLCAVVPGDHRCAGRRSIAFRELDGESFVVMDPEHTLRLVFDDACARHGVRGSITFEGTDIGTLRGLVGGGLGVAVLPPAAASRDDTVEVPLTDPDLVRSIGIGWLHDRYLPSSAIAFRDSVIDSLGSSRS